MKWRDRIPANTIRYYRVSAPNSLLGVEVRMVYIKIYTSSRSGTLVFWGMRVPPRSLTNIAAVEIYTGRNHIADLVKMNSLILKNGETLFGKLTSSPRRDLVPPPQ